MNEKIKKTKHGLDKANQSFQSTITRLRGRIKTLENCSTRKKTHVKQNNSFIDKLLESGRVTKDELREYFKKQRVQG